MALQDILKAITDEANAQIAQAEQAHTNALARIKEHHADLLSRKKKELTAQKNEKKEQMKRKAELHAETMRRNAVLRKKHELLDRVFEDAVEALAKLGDKDAEALLSHSLRTIKGKGTIRPSKKHEALLQKIAKDDHFEMGKPIDAKGGFIFESGKSDRDFTFENIVREMLRPKTELSAATSLFSER